MKNRIILLTVGVLVVWGITLGTATQLSSSACAATTKGSTIDGVPLDNCAWVGSCGPKYGCIRLGFGGGSQYVYDNKIPACLQDSSKSCYDVKCRVKQYSDERCQNLDDDTTVERRGCKKS